MKEVEVTVACPTCRNVFPLSSSTLKEVGAKLLKMGTLGKEMSEVLSQVRNLEQQLVASQAAQKHSRSMLLVMEQRIAAVREETEETTRSRLGKEYEKKELERESLILGLKKEIIALKHKAEVGSQQLQGEVWEESLETNLRKCFPSDDFAPVPKGVNGGDLVQRVRNSTFDDCGMILWEAKRTRKWSNSWIDKLQSDVNDSGAAFGVIVSDVVPNDCNPVSFNRSVWIVQSEALIGAAVMLRQLLIQGAAAHKSLQSMETKAEILYSYVTGPTFRNRLEGLVEIFNSMRLELERKKRASQRSWKIREKHLEQIAKNVSQVCGELFALSPNIVVPAISTNLPLEIENGSQTNNSAPDPGHF